MSRPPPPPPTVNSSGGNNTSAPPPPPMSNSPNAAPPLPARHWADHPGERIRPPAPILGDELKAEPVDSQMKYVPQDRRKRASSKHKKSEFNQDNEEDSAPLVAPPMLSKPADFEEINKEIRESEKYGPESIPLEALYADDQKLKPVDEENFSTFNWVILMQIYLFVTFNIVATEHMKDTIQEDLKLEDWMMFISLPGTYILQALAGIYFGHRSDSLGRRDALLPTLLLFSLTSIGLTFSINGWMFLALRILQAIGGGILFVVDSITKDVSGSNFSQLKILMGLQIFRPLSLWAAPLICDFFLTLGWSYTYLMLGTWSGAVTIILYFLLEETRPEGRYTHHHRISIARFPKKILFDVWFLGPALLNALIQAVIWFLLLSIRGALNDFWGYQHKDTNTVILSIHIVLMLAAFLCWIWLKRQPYVDSLWFLRSLIFVQLAIGGAFAVLYFVGGMDQSYLFLLCVFLFAIVSTLCYPPIMTVLMQHLPWEKNIGAVVGWEFFLRSSFTIVSYELVHNLYYKNDPEKLILCTFGGIITFCLWFLSWGLRQQTTRELEKAEEEKKNGRTHSRYTIDVKHDKVTKGQENTSGDKNKKVSGDELEESLL